MTTPKIVKSQTLDFGPAMPLQLSKKPTENEPHVAKMRWFNIGSWTAVKDKLMTLSIQFNRVGYNQQSREKVNQTFSMSDNKFDLDNSIILSIMIWPGEESLFITKSGHGNSSSESNYPGEQ